MENLDGAKVKIGASGAIGSIVLNGVDFSGFVSSITYRHNAGELPTLELSISNIDAMDIQSVVGSILLKDDMAAPEAQ